MVISRYNEHLVLIPDLSATDDGKIIHIQKLPVSELSVALPMAGPKSRTSSLMQAPFERSKQCMRVATNVSNKLLNSFLAIVLLLHQEKLLTDFTCMHSLENNHQGRLQPFLSCTGSSRLHVEKGFFHLANTTNFRRGGR
jgi:hypothetical protein